MTTSPTTELVDRFNALELDRFFSAGIVFRGGETVTLRLRDYGCTDHGPDASYSRDYVLTFYMALGGSIEVDGLQLGLVKRWKATRSSSLFDKSLNEVITDDREFAHFEIIGHTGTLAVVAQDFSYAVVRMVPVTHVDSPPSEGGA